jgi:hypothetical protein
MTNISQNSIFPTPQVKQLGNHLHKIVLNNTKNMSQFPLQYFLIYWIFNENIV